MNKRRKPSSERAIQIGTVLDRRFQVTEKFLRERLRSNLFIAKDQETCANVLVKVLHADVATHEVYSRFTHEADLLTSCTQQEIPGIPKAITSWQDHEGDLYFVQEFLLGEDLYGITTCREKASDFILTLSEAEALKLASSVANTLARLHALRVVHRDISPGNILWVDSKEIYLCDFGLAYSRALGITDSRYFLGTRQIKGTLNFIAPEQRTNIVTSATADVFALGATLYDVMVLGLAPEKPFFEMEGVTPPSRYGYNEAWDEFFRRCLAHDPKNRFQNGAEMLKYLETNF